MNQKELLATAVENVVTVREINNNYPFNLVFNVTEEFRERYNGRSLRMELYHKDRLIAEGESINNIVGRVVSKLSIATFRGHNIGFSDTQIEYLRTTNFKYINNINAIQSNANRISYALIENAMDHYIDEMLNADISQVLDNFRLRIFEN